MDQVIQYRHDRMPGRVGGGVCVCVCGGEGGKKQLKCLSDCVLLQLCCALCTLASDRDLVRMASQGNLWLHSTALGRDPLVTKVCSVWHHGVCGAGSHILFSPLHTALPGQMQAGLALEFALDAQNQVVC